MDKKILTAFGINNNAVVSTYGNGLINNTWKISDGNNSFILQKINATVFTKPEFISENIYAIADYLLACKPDYFFLKPCRTINKDVLYVDSKGYFRMFPFIKNSHTINVAENIHQTYEAAKKFGELTKLLSDFPVDQLKITLPDFHNISLRYNDFLKAKNTGDTERINKANTLIAFLQSQKNIVDEFEKIRLSKEFKSRVTHHDTKINNVLFDNNDKGICVIDLDTLMPGYFISDVGDMIRTYVSPVDENEKDFSKITFRKEYFIALAEGYLSEMNNKLSKEELHHFVYAGKFMIYMQTLRFLTDYLNDDVYYGSSYNDQNLIRAGNQAQLLKLLIEQEKDLSSIVFDIAGKIKQSKIPQHHV